MAMEIAIIGGQYLKMPYVKNIYLGKIHHQKPCSPKINRKIPL